MRALSSGDAFAYSGCLGSFSTKRLKMVGEEKDKRRSGGGEKEKGRRT